MANFEELKKPNKSFFLFQKFLTFAVSTSDTCFNFRHLFQLQSLVSTSDTCFNFRHLFQIQTLVLFLLFISLSCSFGFRRFSIMQIRIRNTVSDLPVHVGVDRVVLITELLAVVLPVVALVFVHDATDGVVAAGCRGGDR